MAQYTILNDNQDAELTLTLTDSQVMEIIDQLPEGWSMRGAYASESGNK